MAGWLELWNDNDGPGRLLLASTAFAAVLWVLAIAGLARGLANNALPVPMIMTFIAWGWGFNRLRADPNYGMLWHPFMRKPRAVPRVPFWTAVALCAVAAIELSRMPETPSVGDEDSVVVRGFAASLAAMGLLAAMFNLRSLRVRRSVSEASSDAERRVWQPRGKRR